MDRSEGSDAVNIAGRKTRVPAGFLGMMALVILFEGYVSRHDLDVLDPNDWQNRVVRHQAGRSQGLDFLCFGDSLAKMSVLPRVVESRCGRKGYNLASFASQTPASYFMLRRVLESGARPKAVLVQFSPTLMACGPRINGRRWPHFLSYGECVELGRGARDPGLLGELIAGRLLPSVRCRETLKSSAGRLVLGKPGRWRREMAWAFRHWDQNAGAQVMRSEPRLAIDPAAWQRGFFPAGWSCEPTNATFIDRFLALANAHGVTVYWLLTPIHPAVQAECERTGFDARFSAFVRSWQSRYPILVAIDARHSGYEPGAFMDPQHVGREGAYVLSVELGDLFRRLPTSPVPADRWVALPAYRPRPVDDSIQDVVTTRLAVLGEAGGTR